MRATASRPRPSSGATSVSSVRTSLVRGRSKQLFSQVASLLFNFGVDNDYCDVNPAARMKRPDRAKAFKAWTDKDCDAFEQGPAQHLLTAYAAVRFKQSPSWREREQKGNS